MPRQNTPPSSAKPPSARRTTPRPMTERRLENIAIFYLQRFSTTAAHLRRVLLRRIDKTLAAEGDRTRRPEMAAWVEALVARLQANGTVSDLAYAESLARKLRRLGKGAQRIRTHLSAKGVPSDVINEVLRLTDEGTEASDAALAAALAYARRRRLGPFRETASDRDTQRKDLGALARAGFSLDIARQVLAHVIHE